MQAADYFGPHGPFMRNAKGYAHRSGQIEMARAVEDALAHPSVLLAEAGTGVGKTWAYLLPAVLSGKRVVISTATRALQDQIVKEDLPELLRILDRQVPYVCVKGLGNYLCLRRYTEFMHGAHALDRRHADDIESLKAWRAFTDSGDRADLSVLPEDSPLWPRVTSGTDTRIGARCEHYEDCFVTRLRRQAQDAQILIVNHHLFFADLVMRGSHGASVLPEYDAVVLDEAHRIEDIASDFFASSVSTLKLEKVHKDVLAAFANNKELCTASEHVLVRASDFFSAVVNVAKREQRIQEDNAQNPNGDFETLAQRTALVWSSLSQEQQQTMYILDNALDVLASVLGKEQNEVGDQLQRRVDGLRGELVSIEVSEAADRVAWVKRGGRASAVGSSPVDLSELLREHLFAAVPSVVLTSATLSTSGKFDFIKSRLGIDFEVEERRFESPFEYSEQAALYLPDHLPDPRSPAFTEVASEEILRLVQLTGGGAFVLCTSYKSMRALFRLCKKKMEYSAWMQGQAPKHTLLEKFKEDQHGVLFATQSFWEGVDVPGRALRLVIIDKLPFEVPTDPLVQARCKILENNQQSAFMKYLVPSAALSLQQGFGRLIRSENDFGIVGVMDNRLRTKGYGKVMLRSLPSAQRCDSFEELQRFWITKLKIGYQM